MYYFAYGVNLHASRNREWQFVCNGILGDYRWIINQRGVATVVPQSGEQTHGSVFVVGATDLQELDQFEGSGKYYSRQQLSIKTAKDEELMCWVYIAYNQTPGAPRHDYLAKVIEGATTMKLPLRWIEKLKHWQ